MFALLRFLLLLLVFLLKRFMYLFESQNYREKRGCIIFWFTPKGPQCLDLRRSQITRFSQVSHVGTRARGLGLSLIAFPCTLAGNRIGSKADDTQRRCWHCDCVHCAWAPNPFSKFLLMLWELLQDQALADLWPHAEFCIRNEKQSDRKPSPPDEKMKTTARWILE